MKREDGTAMLIGGDQGQVIARIAEFYIQRRDILRASDDRRGVTMSALTNADAADISQAVRARLKARAEIGDDEIIYPAIDQRGETYSLPLATGDRVRLFRQTTAIIDGNRGIIGDNGDVVEIVGPNAVCGCATRRAALVMSSGVGCSTPRRSGCFWASAMP
jgi:hypothetical protein